MGLFKMVEHDYENVKYNNNMGIMSALFISF